jgi:hypothetical protein
MRPALPVPAPTSMPMPVTVETTSSSGPDWTVIGMALLLVNLLLLAGVGLAWRRWISPASVAAWQEPAAPMESDQVEADQSEAEAAPGSDRETASGTTPETGPEAAPETTPDIAPADAASAPTPAPAPSSAQAPIDEEIVLQGINLDGIELDFDDVQQRREAG